jgi:ribosomal protein S18 acetylase RimI-like enzyme
MLTLRSVQWEADMALLSGLDTSFETDRIYVPEREGLSFRLMEQCVSPPLRKRYPFDSTDVEERQGWDCAIIAEENGQLAGFAAAQFRAWNRRVIVHHLYVSPAFRRQGVGRKLLDAFDTYASSVNARCLWVETQNVNAPAIEFYQRAGFEFCGLDTSLYDPENVGTNEIAVFFARPVGLPLTTRECKL